MLSASALLQDAKTASGLDNYGDMAFAEGLDVLVKSINSEARLSEVNERRFRLELLRLLVNRLRMQRDIGRHPEISEQEILPPVFITSLPRTGSTKLHRMLGASDDFHSMKFWQAYNFAPFSEAHEGLPDPRIAAAEDYLVWMRQRSPLFMAGHPMYADETEEEHILLDAGFNSLYQHAAFLNVPSYVHWVMGLDRHAMFEDLHRMLQYLQWQHFRGMKRRWILKTPGLLGTEATFAEVFVGTDFIVTHRDPATVLPSVAALFCGTLQLFNDTVDRRMAGAGMLANFGETVKRHLQWRKSYPPGKVMDLRFDDIVHNEHEVLSRIYEFLGMSWDDTRGANSDTRRANIESWLKMDAARRESPRKFTLEEFGLDAAAVREKFSGYTARYGNYL